MARAIDRYTRLTARPIVVQKCYHRNRVRFSQPEEISIDDGHPSVAAKRFSSNHALQRARLSRAGCNPHRPRDESRSLGRSVMGHSDQ